MQEQSIENEDVTEFTITFHPESLAEMVADFKAKGLSDEDVSLEIDKIKKNIIEELRKKEADGTLDEEFEDSDEDNEGCGDPNCPNCGGVTYH